MKLITFNIKFLFIIIIINLLVINRSYCEIIETKNEEKTFGEWKVFCEIDDMMQSSHCKIASKFYDNSSVISLQPTNSLVNQFFIIIPKIKIASFVKIRVDNNDLILSQNINSNDFGLIKITSNEINNLYNQMKKGDNLFLRFNIEEFDKEITVKFDLKNFNKALYFYNNKVFKK